ncbi:amino acid/polyamine transporter I [Absidia repens]|uniref:Amino acid/polyamine transporter I n=1 Tax=Absidia repens TaxID=90262 RepID=A0A1X2IE79_9FUNG|nr:amino acid/polyamine transporter I [Absidia repens]
MSDITHEEKVVSLSENGSTVSKDELDYDTRRLEALGYKQEFNREINQLIQFAFGFAVVAVLPNWLLNFGSSLVAGGPVSMFFGWLIVSPFVMCIGLGISEVISAYPVSGGIYSWCFLLTNEKWGPFVSWVAAYINLAGMIATQGTLAWSCASFIFQIVEIQTGVTINILGAQVGLYCAMQVVATLYAFLGLKFSSYLNYFMIFWVFAGTLIVMIVPIVMARDHLQSAEWVFTGFINETGWENNGLAFLLGLLQAGWCLIGYVAPAQIVEGTKRSDITAPRGIIFCVIGSIIQGLILLIPTLFAIQNVDDLLESSNPLATFFQQATNVPVSVFLMVILLVAQFGSLANNSLAIAQLLWALSRDGVIPFSKFWYKLNRFDIPHRCLILELLIVVGIIMPAFGSQVYWTAIMSTAVICVNMSYGLPLFCRLIWKRNLKLDGPFKLGKFSLPINYIAVIWIIFFSVILCIPQHTPVTPENMNWASLMIGAVVLFSLFFWIVRGRKFYKGPMQNIHDE